MRPILSWLVISVALLAGACTTSAPPSADNADAGHAPAPAASAPAPHPAASPAPSTPSPSNSRSPTRSPAPAPADPVAPGDDPAGKADAAVGEVDFSCSSDVQCTVKNVGNCCGYYPACVNVDSETYPEQVKAQCERSGMMSVCGFPAIEACQCVQGRCEPAASGGAALQER